MDGRPKRIKKFAFTIVFVWTGPERLVKYSIFNVQEVSKLLTKKLFYLNVLWENSSVLSFAFNMLEYALVIVGRLGGRKKGMERRNQLRKCGSKRKLSCQVVRNFFMHKLSCMIMLLETALKVWFMDICRHSFKKSTKGGSFTSASLEESYQPFTRFVLKGVKVTAT